LKTLSSLAGVSLLLFAACGGGQSSDLESNLAELEEIARSVEIEDSAELAQGTMATAVTATVEAKSRDEEIVQSTMTPTATTVARKISTATPSPIPVANQTPSVVPSSTATPPPIPTQSPTPRPTRTPKPTTTPTPISGVPNTSASAITSPPSSMQGINTHTEMYGTGADPNIITLGPKVGGQPDWEPYPGKTSMEFELNHGVPVLAPIDMVLVGFRNRSAKYRIGSDGHKQAPYNDLELIFESATPDWPRMAIAVYHLLSSPLLLGHNQNPDCAEAEEWGTGGQAQGHIFFEFDDYFQEGGSAGSCDALMGHSVKRGELIGFAGSVGTHSMAPFRFKVSHTSENPTVQRGNRYLHWVQPGSFFYWKCFSPGTEFPSGVLAYPFECGGYQLPAKQREVNFKYSSKT